MPRPEGLTPDLRERFLREARATATIHHPNVCPVYDVGADGDLPYIVMHYSAGTTLAAHLDERKVLPPRQAVALAHKLALGTAAAHDRNVVHRDLKPQNVLFDPAGQVVLITDFGLARVGDRSHTTVAGAVFGTPLYMSPEQARGEVDQVGPLSDVYALGVILYRMLTGDIPFPADGGVFEVLRRHSEVPPVPPSAVRPGLDPRLDALCLTALAKKPADRYPSARAFADALAAYAPGGDSTAWPAADATRGLPAPPRRSRPRSNSAPTTARPPCPGAALGSRSWSSPVSSWPRAGRSRGGFAPTRTAPRRRPRSRPPRRARASRRLSTRRTRSRRSRTPSRRSRSRSSTPAC